MVTGPVMRDQFHVFGLWVPKNTGSDEAVLESVVPSNPSSSRGLEMRYGAIRVPNRGCQIGSARGWPPLGCRGRIRPVKGFHVPSGARAQILIGARSHELGRWSVHAFRVRYHVGDRHFDATYEQGMGLHVVRDLPWADSSASFSSFQTESDNIGCAYLRSSKYLRCATRTGSCYEMKVVGPPRSACAGKAVLEPSAQVVKARDSWLYHGFRCYVGRASVRCRNQVFEGFFLSGRRSHST
jgi:hypothetical protein